VTQSEIYILTLFGTVPK